MPITQTKKLTDIRSLVSIIYGPPKVGKTTLAAGIPGGVILATEAGLNFIEGASRWSYADHTDERPHYVLETWDDLMAATKEVVESGAKNVILDTVSNAVMLCETHICKKYGEEYKGDGKLAYGKGGTMVANELKRYFTHLSTIGVGVTLIAHSMIRSQSSRAGEIVKTVPFIPGDNKTLDLYNLVLAMCDLILFIAPTPDGKDRVVYTKPDTTYDAGDRSGRLPSTFKLPSNSLATPAENFDALYAAFYGKTRAEAAEQAKAAKAKAAEAKTAG